jgi:hypothetical protein
MYAAAYFIVGVLLLSAALTRHLAPDTASSLTPTQQVSTCATATTVDVRCCANNESIAQAQTLVQHKEPAARTDSMRVCHWQCC